MFRYAFFFVVVFLAGAAVAVDAVDAVVVFAVLHNVFSFLIQSLSKRFMPFGLC